MESPCHYQLRSTLFQCLNSIKISIKKCVKTVYTVRKCEDDDQGMKADLFIGGDPPPIEWDIVLDGVKKFLKGDESRNLVTSPIRIKDETTNRSLTESFFATFVSLAFINAGTYQSFEEIRGTLGTTHREEDRRTKEPIFNGPKLFPYDPNRSHESKFFFKEETRVTSVCDVTKKQLPIGRFSLGTWTA